MPPSTEHGADGTPPETAGHGGVLRLAVYHPLRVWVDSLETLLAPRWDVEVVTAHSSQSWVRHAAQAGRADIVLLHVDAGGPPIADTVAELRKFSSTVAVVGLSESEDPRLVVEAVRAGVRGWVQPTASADHLVALLHGVARGETWIPPRLLSGVLDALTASQETRAELGEALAGLSGRELEILGCLVQGMTRPEIAERYVLSTHTVRTHINNLLRKLDVHSTLAAVALARQAGLPERLPDPR